MSRTRTQKTEMIKNYEEKIKASKAIYIVEPKGVDANETVDMKKELFDLDASYNVIKNTLFKLAMEKSSMPVPEGIEENPKAVVFAGEKTSEAAKVIANFIKKKKNKMEIVVGLLDGNIITREQVQELADLPSREEMLAKTIATMQAPVSGFVNVLAGNVRSIINVINEIKAQKS